MSDHYFHEDPIGQLMGYFGQDSADIYGPTIEEIMAGYLNDGNIEDNYHAAKSIRSFIADHPNDLELVFDRLYCNQFDPAGAGLTGRTFLEGLLKLIDQHLAQELQSRRSK